MLILISGLYSVKDINNDGLISGADKQFKNEGKTEYYGGAE